MQPLKTATSSGVTLSYAFINILVSVHSAVGEDMSSAMRVVCNDGHAPTPIKQQYVCAVDHTHGRAGFVKAREVGDGFVVIPDAILEQEKEAAELLKKHVDITTHPIEEVTSVLMPSGKSYYLSIKESNRGLVESYTLLGHLIRSRPELAFMTKLTLRTSTSLFQLTVAGEGTLVLRQMAEAELVREHPVIGFSELDPKMLELAGLLADQQVQPFLIAEHGSGKSHIIADYAATQTPIAAEGGVEAPAATGNVIDMLASLEQAVGTKARRAAAKKAPARKVAAKKAPAKKVAARTVAVKAAPVRPARIRKVS